MSAFRKLDVRTIGTHVFVGMGAASFWRGAWYILDDHLYPDDAFKSSVASLSGGVIGMTLSQGLVEKCETIKNPRMLRVARFGALYCIATSVVLVWRGTWVGWDVFYEYTHPQHTGSPLHFHHPNAEGEVVSASDRGHATSSGFLSHSVALVCLVGSGLFASVLAPPAATGVIRDFAVKATGNKQVYKGPAARLIEQLVGKTTNSPNNAMIPKTPQLVQTQRNFSRTSTLNRTLVPQHTPSNRDKSTSRPMSYTILSRSKPKP